MDYEKKYKEALERAKKFEGKYGGGYAEYIFPELAESEDERIREWLVNYFKAVGKSWIHRDISPEQILAYLEKQKEQKEQKPISFNVPFNPDDYEVVMQGNATGLKQKENPKSADSIPSDCASDAKCEDRWHKVSDSLPDNGRLVLANDCLGNTLLARYDGEGNWEVSVYDNEDYYCRNTITKWCEIPSEKQKEQKPAEWSEEDKEKIVTISEIIEHCTTIPYSGGTLTLNKEYKKELLCFIKSLRPSWKPSEEQQSGSSALKAEGTNE